ncbi:MAG TPA: hypothetical protein VK498_10930 [Ferruginibacter sp.]|nr:hypothetical protein [Ferruginibacter sp.]
MLVFRIPENLDIKKIIKKSGIDFYGQNLKEDKLLYICDALVKSRAQNRKQLLEEGHRFAPLSSAFLQEVIHDYRRYLDFLLANGVLLTDNRFIRGEKCKGYCFNYPYAGKRLKEIAISNYTLNKAVRRAREKRNKEIKKSMRGYGYLSIWWHTDKLKIDLQAAYAWISNYKIEKTRLIYEDDSIVHKNVEIEEVIDTAEDFKLLVWSINYRNPRYGFSGLGHRFYNPICNLKRELRSFLTYDGLPLVDIDLKNSQPFLSTALLQNSFWAIPIKGDVPKLSLKYLNEDIFKEVVESRYYKDIITLRKTSKTHTDKASKYTKYTKYTDLVVNGRLYEYIQEHFQSLHPDRFNTRDIVKVEVLRIFYMENKYTNQKFYLPCKTFQSHFPEVYELFRLIKEVQSNYLAIILQRVESFLILDVVCKAISSQYPQIPIFTIHDNIITTKGNEGIVEAVMSQEIEKWIGHKPKLSTTELSPEILKTEI